MTTLYAWNTARAGSVAYSNVREARLFHPTRGRQFFGLFDTPLPPTKRYAHLLVFIVQLVRCTAVTWLMRLPRALNPNENPAQFGIFFSANRLILLRGSYLWLRLGVCRT
uniref:Uncharacterized protein n=1 Tax=Candidatus Kentrum sp. FM TaxID=2126340 RepID=A0A450TT09_9GAMM|nr:MAG: hypothetical protein BECKFM1743A_GA0114220_106052 [Candidatus Kentron sp. FM]